MISFEDFKKLEIRIGKILSAEKIEGTDKLLKLEIDMGKERRQLVAGLADSFSPRDLVGKEIPVLVNLKPRKIKRVESQGMILAVDTDRRPVLLHPAEEVFPGSAVI